MLTCVVSGFLSYNFSISVLGDVWWCWTWTAAGTVCCIHGRAWTTFNDLCSEQWGM